MVLFEAGAAHAYRNNPPMVRNQRGRLKFNSKAAIQRLAISDTGCFEPLIFLQPLVVRIGA